MHQLSPERKNKLFLPVSDQLWHALGHFTEKNMQEIYIIGGTVRDHLLGRECLDLDLAVSGSAIDCAKMFLSLLQGGTLVDLSTTEDEAIRLVFQGEQIDFSSFRQGARTIEQDLILRDFSINAMAVSLREVLQEKDFTLIDPAGGKKDLADGRVAHLEGAFTADPVRMVRAYRFCAILDFSLDEATRLEVERHAVLIKNAAMERVHFELGKIFETPRTCRILKQMDEAGILVHIFPELYQGRGVSQPDFHHLDVFDHCFQALEELESILEQPELYFTDHLDLVTEYLENKGVRAALKYAALFHDLGKPATIGSSALNNDRVTFYGHDEAGKNLSKQIGNRLKWSGEDIDRVSEMIGMHMHPFHLCNLLRDDTLTRKAVLKLCRRAGDDLVGLFLLAMADSLASEGKLKPLYMEAEILLLFDRVVRMYHELIGPVLEGPRLLTGTDLIEEFQLKPGPIFSKIFAELELARVEGKVADREAALGWVADYIRDKKIEKDQ